MLKLGQLSSAQLAGGLAGGLTLITGPFRFRIQSRRQNVVLALRALYEDYAVDSDRGFRDFHVRIDNVPGFRGWCRPQVSFTLDGEAPLLPLPADHAFAMLEWGMNWCIANHANQFLLLHAAVLERNGCCVILPGDPGAGKSTLTAALMLSGWRLLSDELTMIDSDDGLIAPLARPISLKNQSIEIIRAFDSRAVFGEPARDTPKGTVSHLRASADSVARAMEKGRPAHIVFPRWQADAPTQLTVHSKADAFIHAATHAFNYSLLGRRGFELNAALIESCDCWDFRYSRLDEALRSFEALVA